MKHIPTFESFLNEAQLAVNANLWRSRKPEVVKQDRAGDRYVLYSENVFPGKLSEPFSKPNNFYIAVQTSNMYTDRVFIEVGHGTQDKSGRQLGYDDAARENIIQVSPDALKADPKGYAKKTADLFMASKKYFDNSFGSTPFNFEKDIEKPALELIEFAIKNIK
jgi:hypothetical protein